MLVMMVMWMMVMWMSAHMAGEPAPSPLEEEGWGGGYVFCRFRDAPPSRIAEPVLGPAEGRTRGRSDLPLKGGGANDDCLDPA